MKANFTIGINEPDTDPGKSYWFIFRDNKLLVNNSIENRFRIPLVKSPRDLGLESQGKLVLGIYKKNYCFSTEVDMKTKPPVNHHFIDLRTLFNLVDFDIFEIGGYAVQIINWNRTFRYCGRCGVRTENMKNERAKICPECRLINYPRLSPSMIVAVTRGEEILLARAGRFPTGMYSVLAGFVEPGESLEDCVRREVREEVNIEVTNIRYFGSQPWPFPDSLMVGFIADYECGEIKIDKNEILDAQWFTPSSLPEIPGKVSIARQLIDWHLENCENSGLKK